MAKLININGQKKGKKTPYADSDSVGNLCKYVLGEDEKHSKNEILEIGAYGVDDHGTTQKMVEQMKIVQNAYRIESRGGTENGAYVSKCYGRGVWESWLQ